MSAKSGYPKLYENVAHTTSKKKYRFLLRCPAAFLLPDRARAAGKSNGGGHGEEAFRRSKRDFASLHDATLLLS